MMDAFFKALLQLSWTPELDVVSKTTALFVAGLALTHFAGRRAAYIRHLMLAATFFAALVLPLVVVIAPRVGLRFPVPAEVTSVAPEGGLRSATRMSSNLVNSLPKDRHEGGPFRLPTTWETLFRVAWISGSILLFLKLALDLRRLRLLRRGGRPCPGLEAHLQSFAVERGVRRQVELLVHPDIGGPVTCGFTRPAILLPSDAESWSDKDLRCALVHEMEHVLRSDWGVQMLARVTSAVYWFHPLVWMAWRKLSLEAERACDDAVIEREERTSYAEQLVSLARRLSCTSAQPAIGMARQSDLSARVRAVLDADQIRGRSSAVAATFAVVFAMIAAVAIGPLDAVAQTTGQVGRVPSGRSVARHATQNDEALFAAAERGDQSGVEKLLLAGANVNAKLSGDGSPLIAAVRNGHDPTVTLLLNRGADVNLALPGDGSPLIMSAEKGHLSTVRLLLDRGADIHMAVPGDGNALIMAARGGSVEIVEFLISRGANIEQVVPGDENALIEASASGHLSVVKSLVRQGANVNSRVWVEPSGTRPGEWRTPLTMAHRNDHAEIATYLLSAGARE
ncbi:MAG: ankyrin repeat domain-containing protein [Bryobacteraceae bacterium]|nr:ankyrin repeat domain-containing protein [Bryobacteraceae bacterium]